MTIVMMWLLEILINKLEHLYRARKSKNFYSCCQSPHVPRMVTSGSLPHPLVVAVHTALPSFRCGSDCLQALSAWTPHRRLTLPAVRQRPSSVCRSHPRPSCLSPFSRPAGASSRYLTLVTHHCHGAPSHPATDTPWKASLLTPHHPRRLGTWHLLPGH